MGPAASSEMSDRSSPTWTDCAGDEGPLKDGGWNNTAGHAGLNMEKSDSAVPWGQTPADARV